MSSIESSRRITACHNGQSRLRDAATFLLVISAMIAASVPAFGASRGLGSSARHAASVAAMAMIARTGGAYHLDVSVTGSGMGSVTEPVGGINCPGTCASDYGDETPITLTAHPSPGSVFQSWTTGPCAGSTSLTCSFTILQAGASVQARFDSASVCCDNATGACTTMIPCPPGSTLAVLGSCTPNPCSGFLTACCVGPACSIADAATCAGMGGVFQGVNTLCFPNACAVGACCEQTNAACSIKTSVNCAELGASYRGNGSTCSPNPCPALSGACCIGDFGTCELTLASGGACPGTFQGIGTTCSPLNPCAGACCSSTGIMCVLIGSGGCTSSVPGGVFLGLGTTCAPNPCGPNACCNTTTGQCSVVAASTACGAGSVLASPATGVCTPQPCPQPTACCNTITGACTIAPPSTTCGSGTTAASPVSNTCTPDPCPKGACCDTLGGCSISSPTGCTVSYLGNGSACAPGSCLGACCFASGACGATGLTTCLGNFQGIGTSCLPATPCPQPTACCNTTSGGCSVVLPLASCPPGTVAGAGGATSCTAGLCPQPTACCDTITAACVVAPPSTLCPGGATSAPGGASACSPSPCPFPGSPALIGCGDCWLNGAYDGTRGSGQASHLGGAVPNGSKAADDFTLAADFVHDLRTITATLLTTTTVGLVKPRAEIWSDCNGCPAELLYTFDNALVVETGLDIGPAFDGRPLRIVHVTFDVTNQTIVGNRNVVLHGGTYWLSVYGRSDGLGPTMQMYDVTYWGTTRGFGGGVQGKPAYKIDGLPTPNYNQFNFPAGCGPNAWHSVVDDCCIGCTDLNFTLCATKCKVLIDNGSGRHQVMGEDVGSTSKFAAGSFSAVETRSADDFVLPPCQDYHICYVEACILTNCPTFDGIFEIYANDCDKPSYALHGAPLAGPFIATKIIPLNYTAFMDGRTVNAFKLEFHDLTLVLPGGRQYWISAGVKYTFSINERAFFCYNADCSRNCLIRWNEGRVLTAATLDDYAAHHGCTSATVCNGWAKVGNDFSFLIAGDGLTTPGPINSQPSCAADYNRDGSLNTADIFDYLNAWFTGCP